MTSYLLIDGEPVGLEPRSREALIRRLQEWAPRSELVVTLGTERDEPIELSPGDRYQLRALLCRWHALDGVLPPGLSELRDALAAASLRPRPASDTSRISTLLAKTN